MAWKIAFVILIVVNEILALAACEKRKQKNMQVKQKQLDKIADCYKNIRRELLQYYSLSSIKNIQIEKEIIFSEYEIKHCIYKKDAMYRKIMTDITSDLYELTKKMEKSEILIFEAERENLFQNIDTLMQMMKEMLGEISIEKFKKQNQYQEIKLQTIMMYFNVHKEKVSNMHMMYDSRDSQKRDIIQKYDQAVEKLTRIVDVNLDTLEKRNEFYAIYKRNNIFLTGNETTKELGRKIAEAMILKLQIIAILLKQIKQNSGNTKIGDEIVEIVETTLTSFECYITEEDQAKKINAIKSFIKSQGGIYDNEENRKERVEKFYILNTEIDEKFEKKIFLEKKTVM